MIATCFYAFLFWFSVVMVIINRRRAGWAVFWGALAGVSVALVVLNYGAAARGH